MNLKTHVIFSPSKPLSFELNYLIFKTATVPHRLVRMGISRHFIEIKEWAIVEHQTASIAVKVASPSETALIAPLYRLELLIS